MARKKKEAAQIVCDHKPRFYERRLVEYRQINVLEEIMSLSCELCGEVWVDRLCRGVCRNSTKDDHFAIGWQLRKAGVRSIRERIDGIEKNFWNRKQAMPHVNWYFQCRLNEGNQFLLPLFSDPANDNEDTKFHLKHMPKTTDDI